MNRLLLVLLILAIPLSVAATDQYGAAAYRQLKFLLTDLSCSAPGTCDLASGTTIGGAAIGGGGGVSDGDKGDITVSGSGAAWAVDASAVDFSELAGAATDGQIPNTITIDLATTATTANAGDSATAFFSSGTLEGARGGVGTALPTCSGTDKLTANGTVVSCATDQTGGGGGNSVEVELDFATGAEIASVVVTGQTWVGVGSEIACAPTMMSTADRAEAAEDAVIEGLVVSAHSRVAGTGFTLTGAPRFGNAYGKYKIHCIGV